MTRRRDAPSTTKREALDLGPSARSNQLKRIYERDLGICQLCGEFCERQDASRDHVIDLSSSDGQDLEYLRSDLNVVLAHKSCNNLKSNPRKIKNSVEKVFRDIYRSRAYWYD